MSAAFACEIDPRVNPGDSNGNQATIQHCVKCLLAGLTVVYERQDAH